MWLKNKFFDSRKKRETVDGYSVRIFAGGESGIFISLVGYNSRAIKMLFQSEIVLEVSVDRAVYE